MCFNWIDKTGWQCTDGYIKKDHPLSGNIKRIIVKDAVALLFHRSNTPQCVMAGQSMDDLKNIDIQQDGHDLIIGLQGDHAVRFRNRHGGAAYYAGSQQIFNGPVHSVARRDIIINHGGGIQVVHDNYGQIAGGDIINKGSRSHSQTHCIGEAVTVALALPICPNIYIQGAGDVILNAISQDDIAFHIAGSGNIKAEGKVNQLRVDIQGSEDVDCTALNAMHVDLHIAGSGHIGAHATSSVNASIAGSGDIVIAGNPPQRSTTIRGSGDVRFI